MTLSKSHKKTSGENSTNYLASKSSAGDPSPQPINVDQLKILTDAGALLNEFELKLAETNERITSLKSNFDKKIDIIQSEKDRVIETLAIFVALFTFVSINFSFFSNSCLTPKLFLILDLVIGGFLLIFVVLIRIKGKIERNIVEYVLLIIALLLLTAGIGMFHGEQPINCEQVKTHQPQLQNYYIQQISTPSANINY